jgi:hypothetical protein
MGVLRLRLLSALSLPTILLAFHAGELPTERSSKHPNKRALL